MSPSFGRVYQKTRTFAITLEGCGPIPARNDKEGRLFLPNMAEGEWVQTGGSQTWTLGDFHIGGDLLGDDGKPNGELYSEKDHAYLINGKMTAHHQWLYELLLKFDPDQ
jgi:hypothetical protein